MDLEYTICNNCRMDVQQLLFIKNGFNIVLCKNCGLIFTNPRVRRDYAKSIYDSTYFKSQDSIVSGYDNYLKERPAIEATFKKRINFILRNAPSLIKTKDAIVLDIGCAMGFLLDLFREMGWRTEGVELSEFASSFAKNELNLNIRNGSLDDFDFPAEKYDLVTSWDVIEHSYNPKQDLLTMHRITKKGGYIAIITPNRESFHAQVAGSKWVEYEKPQEHLYFFGKSILTNILEEIGFELTAITTTGKFVSLGFAINRLRSYSFIFGAIAGLIGNRLAKRYVYINPFDKMFLLARKK